MKIVTDHVHPDEPCHGLREGPRMVTINGVSANHWVQRVYVVRGDTIAEYATDYGPVSLWPNATEILYPSFGENSVGEFQEQAEKDRHENIGSRHRDRVIYESTLIADVLRQEEALISVRHNKSHFGPGVATQRDDFPREAARRKLKEKHNGR